MVVTRSQSRKRKAEALPSGEPFAAAAAAAASAAPVRRRSSVQKSKRKRRAGSGDRKTTPSRPGARLSGRGNGRADELMVNVFPDEKDQRQWSGPFVFAQLADTQLGCRTFDGSLKDELEVVDKGVSLLNALDPAFVIVCGDMVNAYPTQAKKQDEQIAAFRKAMGKLRKKIPLVCVCGNHDIGNKPDPGTIARYNKKFGKDHFTFWARGVKCIVMNSSLYKDGSMAKNHARRHNDWLMRELKSPSTKSARHTVVFAHIPPFIFSPDEHDGYFNWSQEVRRPVLRAMKKAGIRKMFCGHYHRNAGGMDGQLEVVITSALGCRLRALEDPLSLPVEFDEPILGTDVSGFRVVRVGDDTIQHKWFVLDKMPGCISADADIWKTSEGKETEQPAKTS